MSKPFAITRRVQFAETDMAGVLHFANYYRWMEEVEHAFWRAGGVSVMTRCDGVSIGWPRVSTSCEYYAPVRFEDEVEIVLRVTGVGNRSATYEVEFRADGKRVALGRSTAVCCTMGEEGFRSMPIPTRLRNVLEAAVQPTD